MHGFISGLSILFICLYFCFCPSTILFWWLYLCSIFWSQEGWFLKLHSSISRLLWQCGVFCVSIWIVKFFVLILWKMPLVIWKGLHRIYRLFWVAHSFSIYLLFQSKDMVYFSIYLYHFFLISFISVLFIYLFCIQVCLGQFLPKDFILSIALVIISCNFFVFIGQI